MEDVKQKLNTYFFQPILCQKVKWNFLVSLESEISTLNNYCSLFSNVSSYFGVDPFLIEPSPASHSDHMVWENTGGRQCIEELCSWTTVPLIRNSCHSYYALIN